MTDKLQIGDLVKFDKRLYRIIYAIPMNWFMEEDPVVYGLVLADKRPINDRGVEIYVAAENIEKPTENEIKVWRVLYGET